MVARTLKSIGIGLAGLFCLLMLVMAAVGLRHAYDLVPFWDMWDGELEFYKRVQAGDLMAWFGQHNEHRIVLSRLLFWMDLSWFQGRSVFLLAMNYVLTAALAGASCLIFLDFLRTRPDRPVGRGEKIVVCLLLTGWIFQWTQYENLGWGFQSQFFLIELLPLLGFYALYRAQADRADWKAFLAACLLGFASIGAMANGVLVLPAMTAYALVVRQPWRRSVILAALSAASLSLFFFHYHRVGGDAPPWQLLSQHPGKIALFGAFLIGNPLWALVEGGVLGQALAIAAAAILASRTLQLAVVGLRRPSSQAFALALVAYLGFFLCSVLLTATGRAQYGLEQAFASRYATPAVVAWAVFAILNSPLLIPIARRYALAAAPLAAAFCALLLAYQIHALKPLAGLRFDRALAGLALELGVADHDQVGKVWGDHVIDVAEEVRPLKISMFGLYPYAGDRESLRQPASIPPGRCLGAMTKAAPVIGDTRFVSVSGWLTDSSGEAPLKVAFLDNKGRLVGYALTGLKGPKPARHGHALSAYKGYMLQEAMGEPVTVVGDKPACSRPQIAPGFAQLAAVRPADFATVSDLVSEDQIAPGGGWAGTDYYHTVMPGLRVIGSYVSSDKDVGSLRLTVRPGQALFYRSGPTGGRQILKLGSQIMILPASEKWLTLQFTSQALPAAGAAVEFEDQGDGWGEWSAIAVRTQAVPRP